MNNRIYYSEEAAQVARRQTTLAVILFTAFGLGIGAALALLFAPSKGEEIRHNLSNTVADGVDKTGDAIHKMEKDISELRKRIEDRVT